MSCRLHEYLSLVPLHTKTISYMHVIVTGRKLTLVHFNCALNVRAYGSIVAVMSYKSYIEVARQFLPNVLLLTTFNKFVEWCFIKGRLQ